MNTGYTADTRGISGPITPPRSMTSSSPSPELMDRVSSWKDCHLSVLSAKTVRRTDYDSGRVVTEPSPAPTPERKRVHWTPSVQDNQGKTIRKPMARPSRHENKRKTSSSQTKPRVRYPTVPEPPRSRGPPPAPRPRRLPTPELPDLKHEEFCSCCYYGSTSKMDAQLAAATAHIAIAKQRAKQPAHRLI